MSVNQRGCDDGTFGPSYTDSEILIKRHLYEFSEYITFVQNTTNDYGSYANALDEVFGGKLLFGGAPIESASIADILWNFGSPSFIQNSHDNGSFVRGFFADGASEARGFRERTGWLKGDDGFLVLDANGNGRVDDISEMFGNRFQGGYDELATYDSNGDGKITMADAIWASLQVWQDKNRDGVTDVGKAGVPVVSNDNCAHDAREAA